MNASRIILALAALLVALATPAFAGFNTTGDGLIVSLDGTGGSTAPGGIVSFVQAGITDPNTGLPASGGLVYFYAPNTTTAKAVYTDPNLTTEANNPVVLNAAGAATVYAFGTYKVVVTNSAGTRITTYAALNYPDGGDAQTVDDFLVLDPSDDGLATRIITRQTASSMSAVYALNQTDSTILPIKFGGPVGSSLGITVTTGGTLVGINKTAPTVALDVVGAIAATGNIAASGNLSATGSVSGASGAFGSLMTADGANILGTATVGALTTSGAVSAGSVSATGTVAGASVSATGAVSGASVSATGAVSGATVTGTSSITSKGNLNMTQTDAVDGASIALGRDSGGITPMIDIAMAYNDTANTSSIRFLDYAANTPPPCILQISTAGLTVAGGDDTTSWDAAAQYGAKLYVNGIARLSGNLIAPAVVPYGATPAVSLQDTDVNGAVSITGVSDAGGTPVSFFQLSASHNATAGTTSVEMFNGVGTIYPLHMNHTGGLTLNQSPLLSNRDLAGENSAQLYVGGKTFLRGDGTNSALEVFDGTARLLSVNGAGGVAIGSYDATTAGTRSFSVWAPAPSGFYKSSTGTGVLLTSFTFSGAIYAQDIYSGNPLNLRLGSTGTNTGLYWKTSETSLGINDDTPSAELDVNGDAAVSTLAIRTPGTGTGTMLGIDPASTSREVILLTSSRRFKTDIEDLEFDWITYNQLRPVTYRMRTNPGGPALEGLIAEEVDQLYPGVVQLDAEGNPFSIDYGRLISPTVAAVKELKRENDELRVRLERLEKIVEALK